MRDDAPAKPRKMEWVWMWLFIGTLLIFLLCLFAEWAKINLTALIIIAIAVIVAIFMLVKEKAPPSFVDALEACAELQFQHNGQRLSMNIRDSEVIPDGPNWIVFFWKTNDRGYPAAYRYDPTKRAVIGREINNYEAILKRLDNSKVLSAMAEDIMQRRKARELDDRRGIDTREVDADGATF